MAGSDDQDFAHSAGLLFQTQQTLHRTRRDRRIGSLRCRQEAFTAEARAAGCQVHRFEPTEELYRDWSPAAERRANAEVLLGLPRPAGIGVYDVATGRRLLADAVALGLRVPEELALISCEDDPLLAGLPSAGLFSLAFRDARNGVAVGGDYQKPAGADRNLAFTSDGGRTWRLAEGASPAGFRSGVAWLRGRELVTVGTSGSDHSPDGRAWTPLDQENYNVVSIARTGAVWAAGPRGRIARLLLPDNK